MMKVIARQRLSKSIRHNVPRAADQEVMIGSDVLLYKERLRNEWVGPYKVIAGDGKNFLFNIDGAIKPASIDKVKIYKTVPAINTERLDMEIDRVISGEVFLVTLRGTFEKFNTNQEILGADLMQLTMQIYVTEVLNPRDQRNYSPIFQTAKASEIWGLVSRKTWNVVNRVENCPLDFTQRVARNGIYTSITNNTRRIKYIIY